MEEWKERVIAERGELGDKIIKLITFISAESFPTTMVEDDRQKLKAQLFAMLNYQQTLEARIAEF